MDSFLLPQASLFLGIIPALVLLFISLKGYEGVFQEKLIFLTFIGGIITGFIAVIIEWFSYGVGVWFVILFPVVEQLIKTMVLNLRRFHEQPAILIYGLCLGLGFGAIFTPFSLLLANIQSDQLFIDITFVLIGAIGIILLHGATGIILGAGVYKQRVFYHLALAILMHIPIPAAILITTLTGVAWSQSLLIIYGIVIYWYATTRVMPLALPQSGRRKRLKQKVKKEND